MTGIAPGTEVRAMPEQKIKMSINATAVSDTIMESARTAMSRAERIRIGARLSTSIAGAGLLIVGMIYSRMQPGQPAVGALLSALASIVVGIPVMAMALKGFVSKKQEYYTEQLISLAILASMARGEYVTATLVPLFMAIGHFLEERSILGARLAIEKIKELNARKANLLEGETERRVKPEDLKSGDLIIVRPGEVLPVDGTVVEGWSSVDQAPVTGESVYEEVAPGSKVFAGTINLNGLLRVTVTGVGADTALGRVIDILKQAESSKAPVTRLIERYASFYLPFVISFAAVVLFLTMDTTRAITVLVVACPCAFVLASPAAMVAALAVASRIKVLIKNTGFLEKLSDIDTLVLDKTGTITLGRLKVSKLFPANGIDENELLARAACAGYGSRHPVSVSIFEEAAGLEIKLAKPEKVTEEPGKGTIVAVNGDELRLGRLSWIKEYAYDCKQCNEPGGTVTYLAMNGKYLGAVQLEDRPRPEAKQAIEQLRKLGVSRTLLVTGDKKSVAEKISDELGFDTCIAEALPEDKLTIIQNERAKGAKIMMLGDGVNDAPALAGADVGVALCAMVNDVAIGSSDIAIMTDNLLRVPQIIRLSHAVRSIINQNVLFGAGFSVAMLTLASMGLISPVLGAILHNGGAIFVVFNSARLLKTDIK